MTLERPASRFEAAGLFLGFAILPPVDAFLAFLVHRIVWVDGPGDGSRWGDPVDAAISFASGVTIVAIFVTVAGAVPTVAWLRSRGHLSLRRITIAAVALGNAPFAIGVAGVVLFYLAGSATSEDVGYVLFSGPIGAVRAIVIGSAMGLASGVIFWVVAIQGTGHGRRDTGSAPDPMATTN